MSEEQTQTTTAQPQVEQPQTPQPQAQPEKPREKPKFTLSDATDFETAIKKISELINESKLIITTTGVEMIAMDPANVAMVAFKAKKEAFTEYDVKEKIEVGINLANLKTILKRAGKSDILSMEFGDQVDIYIRGKSKKHFTMPVIELEGDREQKIPNLEFVSTAKVSDAELKSAIEDVAIVGESCLLKSDNGKFSIIAAGDLSKARVDIEDTGITGDGSSKYAIEYLQKIVGNKISDTPTINLGKEYPLKITYKNDNMELTTILAPRVSND